MMYLCSICGKGSKSEKKADRCFDIHIRHFRIITEQAVTSLLKDCKRELEVELEKRALEETK